MIGRRRLYYVIGEVRRQVGEGCWVVGYVV